ncbi:AmiS/UreI family transporter [Arthrobacter sp. NEB 688]|uniref:AmiS/UreI family transporter n=1 Tax=Arthrobacter sp. NEB 688 TaxID=904039 RepID=UPI0015662426|nr:AmiS/UreI family transporter [Arthrobacter sp. NEB 688]QKE85287.1 transporter [Arthrobacter sp. NEB 688]
MGNVGLLYVGAILFINGCALLGWVRGNGAVPLNVFVGLLQVITPTYLIFTAGGDADVVFGASGLYLFGFTYLYVAMNTIWGFEPTGLGFFSLFVAVAAVAYAVVNLVTYQDYAFTVIWLLWAYLWWLFFQLLGRGRAQLTAWTGVVAAVEGWTTAAVPAFLLLTGWWDALPNAVWALVVLVLTVGGFLLARSRLGSLSPATAPATA